MGNYDLKQQPKGVLTIIDSDAALSKTLFLPCFRGKSNVLLLIRSEKGDPKRGGFFFNIEKTGDDSFVFMTMENAPVAEAFSCENSLKLINHVSGRVFCEDMLSLCQSVINIRSDSETAQ